MICGSVWIWVVVDRALPSRAHKLAPAALSRCAYGSSIPRLYSAGELGSIYSYLYQGTGNIGECLAFGRIAGRNAAAEQPWC